VTYFDDIMRETLRMYIPSGIFPREAVKDHYIGIIPIKKGTLVSIEIKTNQFKEEFY
jgi:cytochrome P450